MNRLALIFLSLILLNCSDDETPLCEARGCGTPATIRDYRGLDGCDFVLELNNGTILEPLRTFGCGTPPVTDRIADDPLRDLRIDGTKVLIDYEIVSGGSVCMVGQVARITC